MSESARGESRVRPSSGDAGAASRGCSLDPSPPRGSSRGACVQLTGIDLLFRSRLVCPIRVRSRVPTYEATVYVGSPEHSPSYPKPRHQSQPLSNANENLKSVRWTLRGASCPFRARRVVVGLPPPTGAICVFLEAQDLGRLSSDSDDGECSGNATRPRESIEKSWARISTRVSNLDGISADSQTLLSAGVVEDLTRDRDRRAL